MAAPWSLASLRKRGKRPLPISPAPSQLKTTNCGGVSPGWSGTGASGWFGCGPVSAVEPSPIGLAAGFSPGFGFLTGPGEPGPDVSDEPQPAIPIAAAAPSPSPSSPLRLTPLMSRMSPSPLSTTHTEPKSI